MSVDFTVAIPTYNGESRLPKILERLRSQIGVDHLNWEVIVVDNNSQDATAKIVLEYQANWCRSGLLKYCLETQQGAAFARARAVQEAKSELVGLLDDDNLPSLTWVAAADAFGKAHPKAGAYASQIHGEFEVEPPDNFERIAPFLGITERGQQAHLYEPDKLKLPPGAGLVVRKPAWCEAVPKYPLLKGRLGESLVGGEDLEPLMYLHKAGWEIWYNPAMETFHQIPSWRLEKDYLVTLSRGVGLNSCCLRMINTPIWQKQNVLLRTFLGSLRRVLLHLIKYGIAKLNSQSSSNHLVTVCELAFYWGYLLSPFYFFKVILTRKISAPSKERNCSSEKANIKVQVRQ
ncbi:MAG TPA: glycosyl transferase [Cyanobacteria bacterium UBA8543]|nr:glycosyl transferase [Cyanobacteria bacterium UBA8543]